MDLVGYSAEVFDKVSAEFAELAKRLGLNSVEVIPVSALAGDNVVEHSTNMGWYRGPTLLEYLETVPLTIREAADGPLRFPVQLVVRPNAEFRGFAGRVERGEVRPGMRVKALPSGRVTTVKSIVTYEGELSVASFPLSVTLELEDEIDLSRGEMLIGEGQTAPRVSRAFRAMVVWMHEQPLIAGQTYLAKHTTRTVRATVRRILYGVDIQSTERRECTHLQMNDIAEVEFDTSLPLFFDGYAENREMGALILIDLVTNATVGAAMIVDAVEPAGRDKAAGKVAAFVWLRDRPGEALAFRDALRERGRAAVIVDDELIPEIALAGVVRALQLAEVTAISARPALNDSTIEVVREVVGDRYFKSLVDASKWLAASSNSEESV
jgi:bifunctional enzyme CysN/CysC/sulfate adenylyltransferase subunit 1